ncbi:MAG: acyl-CoA thioesterase [Deltaproteobacteria bacterium]
MTAPEGYRIKESYRVRYEEVDAQGIVNHAQYAHYFTGARVAYFRALGYQASEFAKLPIQPVVVHLEIDFRSSARFDDHLDVWTRVLRVGETSLSFAYQVINGDDGTLQAEGRTVLVTLSMSNLLPVRVPDELRRRVETLEAKS